MSDANPKALQAFCSAITALEKKRNSKIFCLIHNGAGEHICGPAFWGAVEHRREFANLDRLELLIHSPGGHAKYFLSVGEVF